MGWFDGGFQEGMELMGESRLSVEIDYNRVVMCRKAGKGHGFVVYSTVWIDVVLYCADGGGRQDAGGNV